jgi:hypothetical protein
MGAPTNTHLRKVDGSGRFTVPSALNTTLELDGLVWAADGVATRRYPPKAVTPSPRIIVNRYLGIALLLVKRF